MTDNDPDIATALAQYATTLTLETVPDAVRDRATLVVLDTIGVCLRGSQTKYVKDAVQTTAQLDCAGPQATGGGTTFATADRRPPTLAAFANAAGGTTLELDEGNQRAAHMGVHVVPPALAIAEHRQASGHEFLRAVIAAYEASARVGDAIRPQRDGLHPHGTWAPIGAAVATGCILGIDRSTLAHAIRIAVNPFIATHWAAALEGATVRNVYAGTACRHGIQSAFLAKSGVTGVEGALERCLFPYVAGEDDALETLERTTASLGEEYYVESSYFKIHAACRYTHAPIEAFGKLLTESDLDPDSITSIRVRTFEAGCLLNNTTPETALEAKFSTPYALSALAICGTTGVDAYAEHHLQNERIQRLASAVTVEEDPEHTRRAKAGHWGATVTVETAGGRSFTERVPDARGGGDNPFAPGEIREKFRRLVTGGDADWGLEWDSEADFNSNSDSAPDSESAVTALEDRILDLESQPDVRLLFADLLET